MLKSIQSIWMTNQKNIPCLHLGISIRFLKYKRKTSFVFSFQIGQSAVPTAVHMSNFFVQMTREVGNRKMHDHGMTRYVFQAEGTLECSDGSGVDHGGRALLAEPQLPVRVLPERPYRA
jgi:hypothetical protein